MQHWFTDAERAALAAQGAAAGDDEGAIPLVRLFQPDGNGVWLISELDPQDADLAYGLADLGQGAPEAGAFMLSEVARIRGRLGLAVERDRSFRPGATLGQFARAAAVAGRIVR